MEASTDSFYKYLLNRSKNLHKKLEKIDQKKKQVKSQSKQLTPEEKQLLESEPQIDTAIQEIDRHLKAYTAFKKPTQKAPAKEPPKQVDQSNEVVFLWVISEFLRHPEIRQNLSGSQQQFLEALSKISDSTAGESGDSFEQIMANVQKHLSDYLSKAEATLPGTEVKYQALNDFLNDFYNQNSEKNRPELPSEKAELEVERQEWGAEVEEEKQEPEEPQFAEASPEVAEPSQAEPTEEEKPQEEEGFVEVTKGYRKKKEEVPQRGRRPGRRAPRGDRPRFRRKPREQ